ncbi:hypothetical protein V8F20_003285 [Naviculisporaceae sp. PSN 640]
MFNCKNLIMLTLGITAIASPISNKRTPDELSLLPSDIASLDPSIWDNVVVESGFINSTSPSEPPNPLAKRADFCYSYSLDNNKVQSWGSSWQTSSSTYVIPQLQFRSWSLDAANIKICAVNRYTEAWASTNLASWEIGWAMKAIGGDCIDTFNWSKGGRITGHGTDGRSLHMYLTDVGFWCY